ncbi:hypothetical protein [Brumimicrobium mesophilum]|uniref:hypothetical protein n=1 Tax=Brumimicrobium mesophilum TaxID=392717 RepID=UPI000D13FD39|nr:hypothetical protein [Brumimicrobium mesophilum]
MKSRFIFYLLSLSFLSLFLYSCGASGNGLFEKRKHLKGWHFNKKSNISKTSEKSSPREEFSKNRNINESNLNSSTFNEKVVLDFQGVANNFKNGNSKNHLTKNHKVEKINDENRSITPKEEDLKKSIPSNHDLDREEVQTSKTKTSSADDTATSTNSWNYHSFFLLSFFAPFLVKRRHTRKIQHWAADNLKQSRSLLIGAKGALIGTSLGLGHMLEIPFSNIHLGISLAGIGMSYGLWEFWKNQGSLNSTKKLALIGAVNTSSSFGFFMAGGMMNNISQFSNWSLSSGIINNVEPINQTSSGNTTFVNVLLIILFTLLLLLLLYVIAAVSCLIICSGGEVAGLLFAAVGVALIIFLYVMAISRLFNKDKENKEGNGNKALIIATVIVAFITLLVSLGANGI